MFNLKEIYGHKYRVVDDGTDDSDRVERVSCQEIPGKYGAIYFYGSGKLAARITAMKMVAKISHLCDKCIQDGDEEKVFTFNPDNIEQIAILLKSKHKKVLSSVQIEELGKRIKIARAAITRA